MSRLNKINRRQLIKGGAGGALAMGVLGAGAAPASADEGRRRGAIAVHIHGVLGGLGGASGVMLALSMDVAGRRDDLAGAGWDSGLGTTGSGMVPGGPPPGGPVGACYYTASGRLDDDVVTLRGRSLLTNRPLTTADGEDPGKSDTRADGRDMNATANLRTGAITFSLSPAGASFAGTGTVVVFHGGRGSRDDD